MNDIGHFALVTAWLMSLYGLIAGAIAAAKKHRRLAKSAENSVLLVSALVLLSLVSLAVLFLTHDYRYLYVWRTSNNAMPPIYLVSAIWGGMDGSMLLWAGILGIFAALVVFRNSSVPFELRIWVVPVLSGLQSFFLLVITFLTNPFRLIPSNVIPIDGNGLNPLLQNPSMLIHPPLLYTGFTGLSVPFAFCIAALLSGNLSDTWLQLTRRWTLIAWAFLTAGIILGGNWAYIELGWGGFWAWDPVENASFLPWLSATAFLHSAMVQKRRGSLKFWNVLLCSLSYILTVFGTFLTRSGIVQSVHAFAETDVGWVFLVCIAVLFVVVFSLVFYRRRELAPESRIESFLSRETMFLLNNVTLLSICFTTIWGVLFPIISEAFTGTKSVVGPPFFNQVNVPLFLILILLMGIGPTIAWKRSSVRGLLKNFAKPFLLGSLLTIGLIYYEPTRIWTAVSFGLCLFVASTILGEFHRGIRIRRELAGEGRLESFTNLVRRKPEQYGAHFVHLGVLLMTVSITASMGYKTEQDVTLEVGSTHEVGRFSLLLESLKEETLANYTALRAVVRVSENSEGKFLDYLYPERRFYPRGEETTTEVDIRITPREDLYLALAGIEQVASNQTAGETTPPTTRVTFKVFINPLQVWLWFGSVMVLAGTMIVLAPMFAREFVLAPVKLPLPAEEARS